MAEQITVGARVLGRDATGVERPAVVLYGPARDRFGGRGRRRAPYSGPGCG